MAKNSNRSINNHGHTDTHPATPTATLREEQIALRAYLRAQDRGFVPGAELDDWLAAEREVDTDTDRTAGA